MIVWLASYPRSGNTLLRLLLRNGLGLETYSLHNEGDDKDFGQDEGLSKLVGHISGKDGQAVIEEARSSPELHIIKTHEKPLTDDPAIYIVRDGRSAVVSFFHYIHDRGNKSVSMESIIDGLSFSGSWSSHFEAWNPTTRPNTLFLRFETVADDPNGTIQQLSEFLQKPKIGDFDQSFEELNALSPQFFRSGNDQKNIGEIKPFLGRFAARHGQLMREMGYMSETECLSALELYCTEIEQQLTPPDMATEVAKLASAEYQRFDLLNERMNSFEKLYAGLLEQMAQPVLATEVSKLASAEYQRFDLLNERMNSFETLYAGLLDQMAQIEKNDYERFQHIANMIATIEHAADPHNNT
jgi:hypothetical protein